MKDVKLLCATGSNDPAKTDLKGLTRLVEAPKDGFRRLPGPRLVKYFDGHDVVFGGTPLAATAYHVYEQLGDEAKVYFFAPSPCLPFRSQHPMSPKRP